MIRLYINTPFSENTPLLTSDKHHHYLRTVMRLNNNDTIHIFNGVQGLWAATLDTTHKKRTTLLPQCQLQAQTTPPTLILCPAIIKKENMDLIIQKSTELGATHIIPLITQRTVVRQFNQERATLIATEAAEQCERLTIPTIYTPTKLSDIIPLLPQGATPIFLAERMPTTAKIARNITPAFITGPEGGFTESEITFLQSQPTAHPLHLPHTILRAETAAIAILSCWQFNVFNN